MKNLVWSLGVIALGVGIVSSGCKKEPDCEPTDCVCNNNCPPPIPDTLDFELSADSVSSTGLKTDAEIVGKIHFYNRSNVDTVEIGWKVDTQDMNMDWARAICDNVQCWAPSVDTKIMTLAEDDDFEFKVNFYPNSAKGSGMLRIRFWVKEDSAATTQVANFYATAQ